MIAFKQVNSGKHTFTWNVNYKEYKKKSIYYFLVSSAKKIYAHSKKTAIT